MKHFFESLERKIDFQKEYEKLEKMVSFEGYGTGYRNHSTINSWIEENFRDWKKRGNFISFAEVRAQLGFPINYENERVCSGIGITEYFLFGEMLLNIFNDFEEFVTPKFDEGIKHIIETLIANIEKSGCEIKYVDGEYLIVEKNAVAIAVAESNPNLSDVIIEYNHYLLHGDLNRKKELLKQIADAMEPKRATLNFLNKGATDDFFWIINKMNVRHNNCDPSDASKYCRPFAELSPTDKENWYDKIYDQALMLFVLLDLSTRNQEIKAFKKIVEGV